MKHFSTGAAIITAIVTLATIGFSVSAIAIALAMGIAWPILFAKKTIIAFDVGGVIIEPDFLTKELKEKKGMRNLVNGLRKNYKVVSVTNDNRVPYKAISKALDLDSVFDQQFISSDIGFKKPDKEAFNFLLRKFNIRPKEMVFIDDKQENVESAKGMGIKTIHFTSLEKLVTDLRKSNIVI